MNQDPGQARKGLGLLAELRSDLDPRRLGPILVAGAVTSLLTVIESVSYATLIFSGALAPHLSAGVAIALTTALVSGLVMTLGSSFAGTVTVGQNKIAPVLALMAAMIAASMPPTATGPEILLTVIAAILVSTLVTGLFMTALGLFRLGRLIRFIPYPVIAGFLAGTGWLLLLGSVKAMTGRPVTLAGLTGLFAWDVLSHWLPGLCFAVTAFVLIKRVKHFLVMPALMLGAAAVFYVVLGVTGTGLAEAREAHWLVHLSAEGGLWRFVTVDALTGANWPLVLAQAGGVATVLFISTVAVLLNSSALELASQQELDLDRELVTAGSANLVGGLAGGMVGFTSLTISSLELQMGVRSRWVGLVTAVVAGLMLFFGAGVVGYFPAPLVGGLLMLLGLDFLHKWVVESSRTLPRTEWTTVVLILAVVGLFGFIHGVVVGVVAAIVLFVIKYSRIDVVKQAYTGAQHHSQVERSPLEARRLREEGEQIQVLRLQGFLFFGTANALLVTVKARVEDPARPALRHLLLDFRDVQGADASAVVGLIKLRQLGDKRGFALLFTQLAPNLRRILERGGLFDGGLAPISLLPDLDHGLEHCEELLLGGPSVAGAPHLEDFLQEMAPGGIDFARLERYLERVEVPAGRLLVEQGDPSNALYFLESGTVTVFVTLPDGKRARLRKSGPGTVVGEVGLYLGQARAASVAADEPTVAFRLGREALEEMARTDPAAAAAFHRFMVCRLAQRLLDTNDTVKALLG